jgi:glycyl-tRNA synthetase beta chain
MPELFCELFSEEIPARLQARGARALLEAMTEATLVLRARDMEAYWGPRRIAARMVVNEAVAAQRSTERGPRIGAPEAALAGFLRKHKAERAALRQEGDFWVLDKTAPAQDAAALIAARMPELLWRFKWPKSMRWGGTSQFTWIRPLRRVTCLLDGQVVPFTLAKGDDDGHGLASDRLTEGHRLHALGAFPVTGASDWREKLLAHHVVAKADDREALIERRIAAQAASRNVAIVQDPDLIEEVAGLVEWPVALLGRIDEAFMDLPAEVMQVSMRVNQRYFATRHADGTAAPWFAFVANIDAPDGGAAIISGNERVLRARFADARHFWDLDRKTKLEDRVAALAGVIFHAQLGTQEARVGRLVRLAGLIARLTGADLGLAERAALLAKADLTTGMVGEFPELQGVMGGYYAAHDGEDARVCEAIRDHYLPKGAQDRVPTAPVAIAVALADKLDQIVSFFSIDQGPTGSGDPFALRRAALGIIRIIRANELRIDLAPLIGAAIAEWSHTRAETAYLTVGIKSFIHERLRVQFKNEGGRTDILQAVIRASSNGEDQWPDDLVRLLSLTAQLAEILVTPDGQDLVAAYKRAANILAIEYRKDGHHAGAVDEKLLVTEAEIGLFHTLNAAQVARHHLANEEFSRAVEHMASLKPPLDSFFTTTTVNDENPELRENRLRLLTAVKHLIDRVADLSEIDT